VLERHSAYVDAMENKNEDSTSYLSGSYQEIRDGFNELRYMMLRAPLPGGRTNRFDDGDNNNNEEEEETYDDADDGSGRFYELDVGPADYKYWDVLAGNYGDDADETSMMMTAAYGGQYIGNDNPAFRAYDTWKNYVQQRRRNFPLSQQFPRIGTIMAYMSGDLSSARFETWQEKFCAELLYVNPKYCPRDFSIIIKRTMKSVAGGGRRSIDRSTKDKANIMLNIIDGNAGKAIEIMSVMGGMSSAALPSTLVRFPSRIALTEHLNDSL